MTARRLNFMLTSIFHEYTSVSWLFNRPTRSQMSFSSQVLRFYANLQDLTALPDGFSSIFPFRNSETLRVMNEFYNKYYQDDQARIFLYGINPGRFGAGVTGISFTDPYTLAEECGIPNSLESRREISSAFIYHMINAYGGPKKFYDNFFITSICPIGFLRAGKNANYYDSKDVAGQLSDQIVDWMWEQINFGARRDVAFSIGQGTNFKMLERLNKQHGFFEQIRPLPHPRWVMQYRRKKMDIFADQYCLELQKSL